VHAAYHAPLLILNGRFFRSPFLHCPPTTFVQCPPPFFCPLMITRTAHDVGHVFTPTGHLQYLSSPFPPQIHGLFRFPPPFSQCALHPDATRWVGPPTAKLATPFFRLASISFRRFSPSRVVPARRHALVPCQCIDWPINLAGFLSRQRFPFSVAHFFSLLARLDCLW